MYENGYSEQNRDYDPYVNIQAESGILSSNDTALNLIPQYDEAMVKM